MMVAFMQQGMILTSQVYCETLKKLCRAILNKCRGMLTSGVVLLHDNARPYTTACTRALLVHFNWELFDHPPYSPHLAPNDYHLFIYLKNWLASKGFNNNELMEGVKTWLSSQAAVFDTGIQKLIPRYKRLNSAAKLRSSFSMYIFLYIIICSSHCFFC
jgi:histone-lysine N-methyltransferase SETMAR